MKLVITLIRNEVIEVDIGDIESIAFTGINEMDVLDVPIRDEPKDATPVEVTDNAPTAVVGAIIEEIVQTPTVSNGTPAVEEPMESAIDDILSPPVQEAPAPAEQPVEEAPVQEAPAEQPSVEMVEEPIRQEPKVYVTDNAVREVIYQIDDTKAIKVKLEEIPVEPKGPEPVADTTEMKEV